MKKEPRSDERFVTRCAIADNILRYSFRLDRPDLSKRPKKEDALIDWAVKEAYAMFEPLVGDRIAKPFGELTEEEKALIEEKLIETYKNKNINFNDESLYEEKNNKKE